MSQKRKDWIKKIYINEKVQTLKPPTCIFQHAVNRFEKEQWDVKSNNLW